MTTRRWLDSGANAQAMQTVTTEREDLWHTCRAVIYAYCNALETGFELLRLWRTHAEPLDCAACSQQEPL